MTMEDDDYVMDDDDKRKELSRMRDLLSPGVSDKNKEPHVISTNFCQE